MANTIKIKRSAVQGKAPSTSDLQLGELGINTYDGKLFLKRDNGTASIVEVGAPSGISSLNSLTSSSQTFAIGTGNSGGAPYWASAAGVHTLHLPNATNAIRGLVSNGTQTFGGRKDLLDGATVGDTGVSGGRLSVYHGGSTIGIYSKQTSSTPTANYFTFANSSGTAVCQLTSSGNLGIGGAPGVKLYVEESAASACAQIKVSATSALSAQCLTLDKADNDTSTSNRFVLFRVNSTTGSGQINANGASQAAFGTASDARLKENIADLPPQLDKFLALRPREFDYKNGSGHQIGFVAQEVFEVYPDLVGEDGDGFLMLTDMNKNDARMVKVVQELHAKIEALEQRINELSSVPQG